MSEITVRMAIQGDGVHPFNIEEGTTLAELAEMASANPHLEFRINGEVVGNSYIPQSGDTLIGTQPVKGGIR